MTDPEHEISTYVVAVTGGIGSGKTTVCNRFAEWFRTPVIDTDIVAREVVEPGQPALAELVEHFGKAVLDEHGRLDRGKLKGIVFADENKRKLLENVVHPRIRERMREHLAAVVAPYCLLGIPLLAEGGNHELFDRVLVVDCPESVQIARVVERDQLTEQQVIAIMHAQSSREARLAIADDVILNDGDADALAKKIKALHGLYTSLAERVKTVNDGE